MPIGDGKAPAGPGHPLPGQPCPDMGILGDISLVVVAEEIMGKGRPEDSQGDQPESQADPPPAYQVRGPRVHAVQDSAALTALFNRKASLSVGNGKWRTSHPTSKLAIPSY